MVKIHFPTLGLGRFLRGYIRRRQFKKALNRCDRMNRADGRRHIVVNFGGQPLVLCKADFRELRCKGVFRREITWSMVASDRVTSETI